MLNYLPHLTAGSVTKTPSEVLAVSKVIVRARRIILPGDILIIIALPNRNKQKKASYMGAKHLTWVSNVVQQ